MNVLSSLVVWEDDTILMSIQLGTCTGLQGVRGKMLESNKPGSMLMMNLQEKYLVNNKAHVFQ